MGEAKSKVPGVDRTARAFASLAASSIFGIATTALGFWATPTILHAIGSERFGLTRALTDVFSYLGVLEFGLAGASRSLLATEVASGVQERKVFALAITFRAFVKATAWKLLAGIALIWFSPRILHIEHVSATEVMAGAAVLTVVALSTPSSALQALLSTEQRDYAANLIFGIQNVLITACAVAFAWLHWGIPGQVAGQLLGAIFISVAFVLLTWQVLREALKVDANQDRETSALFSSLNRATLWRMLAARFALLSDRVIVGIFLGGNAVTGLNATVRLSDAVFPHIVGVGNAAWPAIVDIHNKGHSELFTKRLVETTTTICGMGVMLTVPILTINHMFVRLWLGPGFFGGWLLTLVACANVVVLALTSYWDWCFQCTQKVNAVVPVSCVSGAINIIASVAGTVAFGFVGPALGTLFATSLIVVPWEIWLFHKHFSVPFRALTLAAMKPLAMAVPYVVACHWVGVRWLPPHWTYLFLFAGVTSSIWAVIAWFAIFDLETRVIWAARLSRLMRPIHSRWTERRPSGEQ